KRNLEVKLLDWRCLEMILSELFGGDRLLCFAPGQEQVLIHCYSGADAGSDLDDRRQVGRRKKSFDRPGNDEKTGTSNYDLRGFHTFLLQSLGPRPVTRIYYRVADHHPGAAAKEYARELDHAVPDDKACERVAKGRIQLI